VAIAPLAMAGWRFGQQDCGDVSLAECVEAAHVVEVFSNSTIAVNAPQSQLRFRGKTGQYLEALFSTAVTGTAQCT
jgi:hypothetical protein